MTNDIEIFDTDFISEYVRDNPVAVSRFKQTPRERRFTTLVNEAELIGPRYRQILTAANEVELNKAQVYFNLVRDVLTNSFTGIFQMDLLVSRIYVELKQVKKLSKVENADILIAAIALRNDATLVTGNIEHFRKVLRLKVEDFRRR
jgi:predicted nucleic acid-binding protein